MNRQLEHAILTPRGVLRHYWRVAGVRPWHIAIPIVFVLVAGAFEGASFVLLLELTKAVGRNTYDFLGESRAFGWIPRLIPTSSGSSAAHNAILTALTIGLIILGRFGKHVFEYLRALYIVPRTERYRVLIGAETFSRVLGFGRQYFDSQSIGESDVEIGNANAVTELLRSGEDVLRYLILMLVKVGVMVTISLPLSIAFAITLPFVSWFMRAVDRRVERIAAAGLQADRSVRSRILDILGSIPLVKAYAQEQTAAEAYRGALRDVSNVTVRRERIVNLRYPVEEIVVLLVILVVQGVVMVLTDNFAPGDLAKFGAFLFVVSQCLPDYRYLSMFSLRLAEDWPRLEALTRLFSEEGKFIVPSGSRPFTRLKQGIVIRDLSFQYQPGVDVLRQINATMDAEKLTAIVGKTGAGKTTLVDVIARFYDCPPGTVLLDGVDIREFSLPTLKSRMALVSQDVWLLNRTLRDNLTFGLDRAALDAELESALQDVDLHEFVGGLRAGLDTVIGDHGVRLSGGQRQRVALARALLRDPDILILDEATSALDSLVEQRVALAIQQRAAGRTLIVIAHRLSTIQSADKILVMHDGQVAEQGTWDELLNRSGLFSELYGAQYANGLKPATWS
jgi:ABC-type multidrug transport system fused ATPase/permease subunit